MIAAAAGLWRLPTFRRTAAALLVALCFVAFYTRNTAPPRYQSPESLRAVRDVDAWLGRAADGQVRLSTHEVVDNSTHQTFAHVRRSPISARQCDAVDTRLLQKIADKACLTPTDNAAVFHFHDGRLVDNDFHSFDVGDEFCSIVLAPQPEASDDGRQHRNVPIRGWGPDSIHAEVFSADIRLIVQHPDYWGAVRTASSQCTAADVAIYTIPYALNHPGTYQISGEVDFQSYDWVMEDAINLVGLAEAELPYSMLNIRLSPRSPPIYVLGDPVDRPEVVCYSQGETDLRGRWYRAASFGEGGSQTRLNPKALLEFADYNNTVDEWGWTFAPDSCSLMLFNGEDHLKCLENRSLQVLGDTGARRLAKSIIGGGQTWCLDPLDAICQCEDYFQEEVYDPDWSYVNAAKIQQIELRDDPTEFGRGSKVFFDFVGGLLTPKPFNIWHTFYDARYEGPDASIVDDRAARHGPVDVVVLSLLAWDVAAVRTPSEMRTELPAFRETINAAYKEGTGFVHRLANGVCCGYENRKARYSAPRFAMWNAMYRDFWADDEWAGKVMIVDPSVLQGRRDAETAFQCPQAHLRGSHVRLEQMMWMNAVCEKVHSPQLGVTGVRMKQWP